MKFNRTDTHIYRGVSTRNREKIRKFFLSTKKYKAFTGVESDVEFFRLWFNDMTPKDVIASLGISALQITAPCLPAADENMMKEVDMFLGIAQVYFAVNKTCALEEEGSVLPSECLGNVKTNTYQTTSGVWEQWVEWDKLSE
jgi:hypothetical protein